MRVDSQRRRMLARLGGLASAAGAGRATALLPGLLGGLAHTASASEQVTLPFANGQRELIAFPEKRPLIVLTARPPQLETPFRIFDQGLLTPNDAFFVRYHLSGIPTHIDPASFRLRIGGLVNKPLELSLRDLAQNFTPVEVVAVNQCSGNSRGFFAPRTNGGQLANGAMGNARWKGVPLKALLDAAGVAAGARQVSFDGLDEPAVAEGGDFVKALDIDHARDGEVMVAWEMNGAPLPMLNGFPLRLIVPGYYGTYWVKHLSSIEVLDHVYDGYWMKSAYRVPDNDCHCVEPGTQPKATIPIERFTIRSFITSHVTGDTLQVGKPAALRGIAFDSGRHIEEVALSGDGGQTWQATRLGASLGRYSFQAWEAEFTPPRPGPVDLRVRARNRAGESQPVSASWNGPGYLRNVIESTVVTAL